MDLFQLAPLRLDQVGPVEYQDVGKGFDAVEQLAPGLEDDQFADGFFDLPVVFAELGLALLQFDTLLAGLQDGGLEGAAHLAHRGEVQYRGFFRVPAHGIPFVSVGFLGI